MSDLFAIRSQLTHSIWDAADSALPGDDSQRLAHVGEIYGDCLYAVRAGADLDGMLLKLAGAVAAALEQGVDRARCATKTDTQTREDIAA